MASHAYRQEHACKRPNVATLDHWLGCDNADQRPIVNRVCLTCGTHWYGDALAGVFEMPLRVWEGWMESAFASERLSA